jgi:hypothetical protein
MRRWPSISYLVYRDSRIEAKHARDALLAHCRRCGCIVCQVRLAMMNESFETDFVDVHDGAEKVLLKEFLN